MIYLDNEACHDSYMLKELTDVIVYVIMRRYLPHYGDAYPDYFRSCSIITSTYRIYFFELP